MLLLTFTFIPAHATSSDQPEQPTITTTVENSEGIHTETKPYIEGQSSGVEYFRNVSVSISLTSSVSTSALLAQPSSALSDAITVITEMVIAGLIVWAFTSYLEDMLAKRGAKPRPPPPGIVVGIPSLRKSEVAQNQLDLHCSFFVKNSNIHHNLP